MLTSAIAKSRSEVLWTTHQAATTPGSSDSIRQIEAASVEATRVPDMVGGLSPAGAANRRMNRLDSRGSEEWDATVQALLKAGCKVKRDALLWGIFRLGFHQRN